MRPPNARKFKRRLPLKCPNCGKEFNTYGKIYGHMKYWCKKTDNNLRGKNE